MLVIKHDFARLLSQVAKAVEARNTIPILGHVKLVNAGGLLTVTATDLDIEISGTIPAEGADAAFTVDAKMLTGIVSKLGADTIDIAHADSRVTIKAGRSRFTLDTLSVDDFPTMAVGAFDAEIEIDLAALIAPVQFAISTEETRFYLNGVFLHEKDGHLVAVATDGHRLARHIGPAVGGLPAVILPRKTVGLLPKGPVKFAASDTKVRIVADGVTILSKVIQGTFPDYERVIPANNDKIATFTGTDMVAAAGRVAVVSAEKARAVKLGVTASEISLYVRGDGEAEDSVACTYDGKPEDIGFNSAYLSELVATLGDGDVQMAFANGGSPAVFTGSVEGLLCVLMPMRM